MLQSIVPPRPNSLSPRAEDPTPARLTVDELARATGTTTRQVRALQTRGLLPHPDLVARTGYYGTAHLDRLRAILRLQGQGFSLTSLGTLMRAREAHMTLAEVLGLQSSPPAEPEDASDAFSAWDGIGDGPRRGGTLLSLVPSTILDDLVAS
jgi:DNA-binding transcriptional MerR regulator